MHFLQIQNPDGLFSNDFIFHVAEDAKAAPELKRSIDAPHTESGSALSRAVARGDLEETKKLLAAGASMNARQSAGGSTPLSDAALYGHIEIVRHLLKNGAKVGATNEDGNTPLHAAAFLCRSEIVQLLLENGGSVVTKNKRGETPIDVVSSPWNRQLSVFYEGLDAALGLKLDLKRIEKERPQLAKRLRERAGAGRDPEKRH